MIKHIKGSANSAADNLSCLPICDSSDLGATYPAGRTTPVAALPEIKKMAMTYEDYDIKAATKCLAANPTGETDEEISVAKVIGCMPNQAWDILPLSLEDVAVKTREDKVYGQLLKSVEAGVLDTSNKDLRRFSGVFDDLYIEDGVVYFGSRVVIPTCQQPRLLEELHYTHIGAVRMKYTEDISGGLVSLVILTS